MGRWFRLWRDPEPDDYEDIDAYDIHQRPVPPPTHPSRRTDRSPRRAANPPVSIAHAQYTLPTQSSRPGHGDYVIQVRNESQQRQAEPGRVTATNARKGGRPLGYNNSFYYGNGPRSPEAYGRAAAYDDTNGPATGNNAGRAHDGSPPLSWKHDTDSSRSSNAPDECQGPFRWLRKRAIKVLHRTKTTENLDDEELHAKGKTFAPPRDLPFSISGQRNYEIERHGKGLVRVLLERRTGRRRILHYDERRMYEMGWLGRWRGTVFETNFVWGQLTLLLTLASITAVISFFASTKRFAVQVDYSGLTSISSVLDTLVSFILALYIRRAVVIWWETSHVEFYKLVDTVDGLVLRTAIYFSGDDEEDREIRYTMLRYGILSIALFFKDARNIDARDEREREKWDVNTLDDLVEDGLLTLHEKELLSTPTACAARSQMVWVWIASLVTKFSLEGKLPDPTLVQEQVLKAAVEGRSAIGKLLNQLNTQLPFPYAHTVTAIVKTFLFALAFQAGLISGFAIR